MTSRRRARDSCAAKGKRFEAHMVGDLESAGFFVMRSHRSIGPADLIAIGNGGKPVLFVQCKGHAQFHRFTMEEWNALYDVAIKHGGVPIAVFLKSGQILTYRLLERMVNTVAVNDRPWRPVLIKRKEAEACRPRLQLSAS